MTKFLARDRTSDFLFDQTQRLAASWIEVIQAPDFVTTNPHNDTNTLLLGWHGDSLVLQKSLFTLEKPRRNISHRITIDNAQWVLSSLCDGQYCVTIGLKDIERKWAVRYLMMAIFIPLAIIFMLAMLAMYYAVKSGLLPLNNLANTVSSVSIEKLDKLTSNNSSSELLPLVNAINQLLDNMKEQLSKERLFLDTCTHELRTPVTALLAMIQNLEAADHTKGNTTSNTQAALEQVTLAGMRTVRVANQFLHLAKNSNARASAHTAEIFDLPELNRQVIAEFMSRSSYMVCTMEGLTSLKVIADSLSMEMVCRNLIENASKYGANTQKGKVYCIITLAQQGDLVSFTVEDNGFGVEDRYLSSLSERFYRAPPHKNRQSVDGAGLGLSIVEEVAKRYQGSINIEKSQRLGGLKVTVHFHNIMHNPSA